MLLWWRFQFISIRKQKSDGCSSVTLNLTMFQAHKAYQTFATAEELPPNCWKISICSADRGIYLRDTNNRDARSKPAELLRYCQGVLDFVWSSFGGSVASASDDWLKREFHVDSKMSRASFNWHLHAVTSEERSGNGDVLVPGSMDDGIWVFDLL